MARTRTKASPSKESHRPIMRYVVGLVLLLAAGAALAVVLYVRGRRFHDVCSSAPADTECRLLCHPEEVYARRVLLTMGRVPVSLETCVNLAARVGSGKTEGTEGTVASCVKEAGSIDPAALNAYKQVSEKLDRPSSRLVTAWEQRCLPSAHPSVGRGSPSGLSSNKTKKQNGGQAARSTIKQPTSGPSSPFVPEVPSQTDPDKAQYEQNHPQQ